MNEQKNLVVLENENNEKGIHDNMDTLEVAKNMFKGTWILGKRAAVVAKEMAEKIKERAEELKNNK